MHIINFKTDETWAIQTLKICLENFLDKDTLVINDTRWMIIPSVLPFIEFVCTYDQRVFSMLKNTNVIFTEPFSLEVQNYYKNLWLIQNVNVILTDNIKEITLAKNIWQNKDLLEKLKSYKFKKIVPFFVNDDMDELSKILDVPLNVSKNIFVKANDKLLLKKYLLETWLPTIDGDFTSDIEVLKKYFEKTERYLFKDPLWVSGYWFWDNKENTFEELEKNYAWKELIIEKFIEKESSPSVQFFISEDKKYAIIFWITDQLLEKWKIYLWNKSPSIYSKNEVWDELLKQSVQIIEYIANLWYTWFAWIDFIVDTDKKVYATEVNARFTWATYPAITSMLLKSSLNTSWEFFNYEWESEKVENYLNNKVIKNTSETWIFPLWLSWIEKFGKANLLKFN